MNGMRLFQDNTRIQFTQTAEHLHMLTAHDAKGRQFQVVIIYGADKFETGDIEEDRRLLYVAMTRAEKSVHDRGVHGKEYFVRRNWTEYEYDRRKKNICLNIWYLEMNRF